MLDLNKLLKDYLTEHGLKGGIVRKEATADELCICIDNYSEDIQGNEWEVLNNIF